MNGVSNDPEKNTNYSVDEYKSRVKAMQIIDRKLDNYYNTENEVLDQYIFDTYGKILVENCNPILLEYLKKEQGQLENILKKLENSNSKESSAYAETLEKWALNEKTQKKFKKV